MPRSNINEVEPAPGLFSLIFQVPFYLLFGAIIGAVMLIYTPVLPADPDHPPAPGQVVFTPGTIAATNAYAAPLAQLRAALNPRIEVSEGQVNSWIRSILQEPEGEGSREFASAEFWPPIVKFREGNTDLLIQSRVSFFNHEPRSLIIQASTRFGAEDGNVQFRIREMTVGSLRADRIPFLKHFIWNRYKGIFGDLPSFEEMDGIVRQATRVSVDREEPKITFQFAVRGAVDER